jgi:hypothetical protein
LIPVIQKIDRKPYELFGVKHIYSSAREMPKESCWVPHRRRSGAPFAVRIRQTSGFWRTMRRARFGARGSIMRGILSVVVVLVVLGPASVRAAGAVPERTGDFLAYCRHDKQGCEGRIFGVELALIAAREPRFRAPDCPNPDREAQLVWRWLAAHPEMHDRPTTQGIAAAWVALYPRSR